MNKSLNQTKQLLLFLSICIGSLTFTTQAQNPGDLKGLFLSCKDTSQSVDKSLRDVVINTVKATDLFLELGKMKSRDHWDADVSIRDRLCAMKRLGYIYVQYQTNTGISDVQAMDLDSELRDRSGGTHGVFDVPNGDGGFYESYPRTDRAFCKKDLIYKKDKSKCNQLRAQILKSKYSLEQTFDSKTWNQDFLGGIVDIKGITVVPEETITIYKIYVVTHKSNPDSAYVFVINSFVP